MLDGVASALSLHTASRHAGEKGSDYTHAMYGYGCTACAQLPLCRPSPCLLTFCGNESGDQFIQVCVSVLPRLRGGQIWLGSRIESLKQF